MKKLFLLAFILISTFAHGQLKCCFNYAPQTDPNYDTVHFENTSASLHYVYDSLDLVGGWADGIITWPYGYTGGSYKIFQMGRSASDPHLVRRTEVASGSGSTVHARLPAFIDTGMDSSSLYELRIYATRPGTNSLGDPYPALNRSYPAEWRTMPTAVTAGNADIILDFATASQATINAEFDDTWGSVVTTRRRVLCKNTNASARFINIFYKNYLSTKPYQVGFENCSMTVSSGNTFHMGPNEGVIIDGMNGNLTKQLTLTHSNSSEVLFVQNYDGSHAGKWIWVGGVIIDGAGGGTGLAVQSSFGTFNETNFSSKGYIFSDMLITNTSNEASYFGGCCSHIPQYFPFTHIYIFRIRADDIGNEGMQIGNAKYGEIFNNVWTNTGTSDTPAQNYNHQFNSNCDAIAMYRNWGLTSRENFETVQGDIGGNVEYFANFSRTTKASGSSATFWHFSESLRFSSVIHNSNWNTWVKETSLVYAIYNDDSPMTTVVYMNANGNALVSNTTTQASYNNGFDNSNTIMNNKAYSSTGGGVFLSPGTNNFSPASLTSSLFTFTTNSTAESMYIHPNMLDDYYGYRRDSNSAAGAYSGFNLVQH